MPQLFADRAQEGQVKQGLLGDCWFLCACAALQKSQHLLDQVSATVHFLSDPCFLSARVGRKQEAAKLLLCGARPSGHGGSEAQTQ